MSAQFDARKPPFYRNTFGRLALVHIPQKDLINIHVSDVIFGLAQQSNFYERIHKTCFHIHIHNNNASQNCFEIIDSDKLYIKLKIKEGFHITREKPELNVQVKHFKSSLI